MRRNLKLTLFALAAVFGLLALAPVLTAQPGHHGGGPGFHGSHGGGGHHGGGHGIFRALHRLDLTEAQKEEIHGIFEARRDDGQGDREALMEARKALHETVMSTPVDEAAIRAAAAAAATLEADQAVAHAETYNAVYAVLTPEQREQLAELREEAGERRRERRERFKERREERRADRQEG